MQGSRGSAGSLAPIQDPEHLQQPTLRVSGGIYYLSPNPTGLKLLGLCSLTASGQEFTAPSQCWQGVIYPEEGSERSGEQSYKLYFILYFMGSVAHFDPESTHTPTCASWP